jgi:type IX secretion system PorP/SprF family membrane protein
MKLFFVTIFILLFSTFAHAQDPHFSQFFASPLTLNPASTGKFDGSLRLAANYRNQWPSIPNAYRTASASVDFPLLKKGLSGDILGLGFSGVTDQSVNGAISLTYGSASLAYHKALDEDGYNTIGLGFQGTYSTIFIDQSKLTFEDQILNFTPTSQEASTTFLNGSARNYFDMNVGALFSGSSDGSNNYYGGISVYHVNTPSLGFEDKKWKLKPRTSVNIGGTYPLGDEYSINASALYQIQNEATEFLIGGALCDNVNNSVDNPTNLYIGSWYRLNDAIIPYVGLEFSGVRIGLTYDVNVSSLKAGTQARGGSELSLIYIKKTDDDVSIPCPKF